MSQSLDILVGSFFSTTGGRGNYRVLLKRLWRHYQQVITYIQWLDQGNSALPGIKKIGKWAGIASIAKPFKGILGAINRVPKIPNRVNKRFMQNLLNFAGAMQFTTTVNDWLSTLVPKHVSKLVQRLKLKCCKSKSYTAPCKEKWLQLIARLKEYAPRIIGLNGFVLVDIGTIIIELEQTEEDSESSLSESESVPRSEFGQNEGDSTSLLPESKVTETESFDSMMETIEGQLCIAESFLDYPMTEEKETGDRNNPH